VQGESALRRNRSPADCKEEKELAEEAISGRDVGCPAGSAQRQIHEGRSPRKNIISLSKVERNIESSKG